MEFNPQWIALISACTAMIAAVAGPYVNTRIANLQFKTNVLSVNRHKWIETLRDLVSILTAQLLTAATVRHALDEPAGLVIARDPELFGRVEGLIRTAAKIELMLNPLEEDHQNLNRLMQEAIDQLRTSSPPVDVEERVQRISREIIQVAQGILKQEWGRVKSGS